MRAHFCSSQVQASAGNSYTLWPYACAQGNHRRWVHVCPQMSGVCFEAVSQPHLSSSTWVIRQQGVHSLFTTYTYVDFAHITEANGTTRCVPVYHQETSKAVSYTILYVIATDERELLYERTEYRGRDTESENWRELTNTIAQCTGIKIMPSLIFTTLISGIQWTNCWWSVQCLFHMEGLTKQDLKNITLHGNN